MRIIVSAMCFWMLLVSPSSASAEQVTFQKDGKANVQCQCVLATTGCQSKLFSSLAGKEIHSWHQEINVKKNMRLNLNEVCYRKRNVDKLGDGLCCTTQDETKNIDKLFRGTVFAYPK
jgi:hypothetical protein